MLTQTPGLTQVPRLVHGFSDRCGGVSRGRYASLNLSAKWGDDPAAVQENHRRLAQAAGYSAQALVTTRQVHGASVVRVADVGADTEADAIWCTFEDQVVVGVLTADCVPVVLADTEGTVACAIHSGWRGTVAGVVVEAVNTLGRVGISPSTLRAAVGPCIGVDGFEVGPEVARQFDPRFVREDRPRPHVDLRAAVVAQLEACGVRAVEHVDACTHRDRDHYFSYRRDGEGIGQMLSFAGFVSSVAGTD